MIRFAWPRLVAASLIASACQLTQPVPLRTATVEQIQAFCAGYTLVEATLRADSASVENVWLEAPDGTRHDVTWPTGYSARLDGDRGDS